MKMLQQIDTNQNSVWCGAVNDPKSNEGNKNVYVAVIVGLTLIRWLT